MMKINFNVKRKIKKYCFLSLYGIVFLSSLFLYFLFCTSYLPNIKKDILSFFQDKTAELGFALDGVEIEGNNNTKIEYILNALNLDHGTPIFSINLNQVKTTLESNDWVKLAVVTRKLPNIIHVGLLERKAIALWQYNKNISLIDDTGYCINIENPKFYKNLLYVVGSDANIFAKSLVDIVSTNERLRSRIISAVRYGQRRWNLILDENITVKMPEVDLERAWKYLLRMNEENRLFGQQLKVIDLLDPKRYFFEKYQ